MPLNNSGSSHVDINNRYMYYIKLLGFIPENKQLEFEKTYRFIRKQIPATCTGHSISKDSQDDGVYYFVAYWEIQEALHSFTQSSAFFMLIDAFRTLGDLRENSTGEIADIYLKN